jgi:hypothetical protein
MKQDDIDPQLAANAAKVKERLRQEITIIRTGLTAWLDHNTHKHEDAAVNVALLEVAIDKYLAIHDEADALDLIQKTFRSIVTNRYGTMQ